MPNYRFFMTRSLREKCPYSDFFCSWFSRIRTEYWKIRSFIGKEIPSQVFSWEYWGIFRNNFFEEYLRTAASAATNLGKSAYVTVLLWSVCWLGSFVLLVASAVISAHLTFFIEIIFYLFIITKAINRRNSVCQKGVLKV